MKIEYWTCIVILWMVLFDSLRDGFKESKIGFWNWHLIKWCQFFPIIIYLMILTLHQWYCWIGLAVISWCVWQFGIKIICKKNWETIWVRVFRKLFKKK